MRDRDIQVLAPSAAEIARMDRVLAQLALTTRAGIHDLIPAAIGMAVQSARKVTPRCRVQKMTQLGRLSKTQRHALAPVPPWWAQFKIQYDRPGQPVFWESTREKALARRIPARRGLAKAAWGWGLAKINQRAPEPGEPDPAVDLAGWNRWRISHDSAAAGRYHFSHGYRIGAEVTNRLKYVGLIAPTAASVGLARAANRLSHIALRQLDARLATTASAARRAA